MTFDSEEAETRAAARRRNTGTVRDGARVTFLLFEFGDQGRVVRKPVRAFAIGDQAVVGKRAVLPDPNEPQRDVHVLGWLRPEAEGTRWCRGWSAHGMKALLATAALENSR